MTKAVLRGGTIQPLEPLPPEWKEGQELIVESAAKLSAEDEATIDQWYEELEAAVAAIPAEEAVLLEAALQEADELAKQQMRREMGLP